MEEKIINNPEVISFEYQNDVEKGKKTFKINGKVLDANKINELTIHFDYYSSPYIIIKVRDTFALPYKQSDGLE